MTPMASRLLVGAIGLPAVLGIVYLGGWWMFTLVAIAAVLALHEYALVIRSLRPLVLAAYAGAILALLGAQLSGFDWTIAGFLATLPLAFVLHWIATTGMGAAVSASWIPQVGLRRQRAGRATAGCASFTGSFTARCDAGGGTTEVSGMETGSSESPLPAPDNHPTERDRGRRFAEMFAFVALYRQDYVSIGESIALGAVIAVAAPLGDLFESALKRDMQVKDSGRLLGGHGGMLDRLDAPLFAAVASYYLLRAFGAA